MTVSTASIVYVLHNLLELEHFPNESRVLSHHEFLIEIQARVKIL